MAVPPRRSRLTLKRRTQATYTICFGNLYSPAPQQPSPPRLQLSSLYDTWPFPSWLFHFILPNPYLLWWCYCCCHLIRLLLLLLECVLLSSTPVNTYVQRARVLLPSLEYVDAIYSCEPALGFSSWGFFLKPFWAGWETSGPGFQW